MIHKKIFLCNYIPTGIFADALVFLIKSFLRYIYRISTFNIFINRVYSIINIIDVFRRVTGWI